MFESPKKKKYSSTLLHVKFARQSVQKLYPVELRNFDTRTIDLERGISFSCLDAKLDEKNAERIENGVEEWTVTRPDTSVVDMRGNWPVSC